MLQVNCPSAVYAAKLAILLDMEGFPDTFWHVRGRSKGVVFTFAPRHKVLSLADSLVR